MVIGIDVGNYNTKTQNTVTPSSFSVSKTKNCVAREAMFYAGNYYSPTTERNNQLFDKTINDYCIIMSLFAIAKEIIWQIKGQFFEEHGKDISDKDLQEKIKDVSSVRIGVGLPIEHYSSIVKKTIDCYNAAMGKGITFTFNELEFSFKLDEVKVYIQDFTAVAFNSNVETVANYSDYYILGIGGGTADVIPVSGGQPQIEKCRSLDMGSTFMYEYISAAIQQETGKNMGYRSLEMILRGEPTIIDASRINRVKELADEFMTKMVQEFAHIGLNLSDFPCVFIGGGAILMRSSLERNRNFVAQEFTEDVNANARYYASFMAA